MVRVVIHDGHSVHIPDILEAASHAAEPRQCLERRADISSERAHHAQRRRGVPQVVQPWHA
jgi:hypothetical protein